MINYNTEPNNCPYIEDTETNIVLITGDVTCNGAKESHLELIPKFQRLKDAGKKVYVTTGTHDYYREDGNGTGKAEKCVGDELLTATRTEREELLEIYHDFGLSEAISIHKPSHSYCVKLQDGYRLLCLNDDGDEFFCGYYDDCLEWIKEQIDDAKANGDYIFAADAFCTNLDGCIIVIFKFKIGCTVRNRGISAHGDIGNRQRMISSFGNF